MPVISSRSVATMSKTLRRESGAKIRVLRIMLDAAQTGDLIDDRFEKDMTARLLAQLTARDYHAVARKIMRTPARTLDEAAALRKSTRTAEYKKVKEGGSSPRSTAPSYATPAIILHNQTY
jgi:hypothetical protein